MIIEYLTAILVFVTAIYAWLTHEMVKASKASVDAVREQSEALTRPYIVIEPYIRPNTPFLYLRIANSGKTGAVNLSLSLDKDFYQFGKGENLKDLAAFKTKMDSFSPDSELLFGLGQGWVIFDENSDPEKTPNQFRVTAEYEYSGKQVKEEHFVDLRPFVGTEGAKDPVVEELEKIRKEFEKHNKKA